MLALGRHVHPVASVMRTAVRGRLFRSKLHSGAKLAGMEPVGTVPHAAVLILGDTVELAMEYDATMPSGDPRIVLVDTFKDEAEESLRVARALGDKLGAIRLDTPGERGGVSPDLVKEIRHRLDQAGFSKIRIIVSGGFHRSANLIRPARLVWRRLYIHADPIDMTMDIKEIDGAPI